MEGILMPLGLILGVVFLALVVFALWRAITRLYRRVPPNKALVVYGRGKTFADAKGKITEVGFRIVTGGGVWVRPFFEETAELSLEIMTIPVTGDEVKTTTGVPIYLDWVAQVKIGGDRESIATAAQVFLGQPEGVIIEKARQTLSGNMREVISGLTVGEVHKERDKFIGKVQQIIADEMGLMGLKVVSLTIQDIYDRPKGRPRTEDEPMGYFEAMAAEDLATVRKTARIATATADREAREQEARQSLAAREAEIDKETHIAEAEKIRDVQKASFKQEADTKKAIADLAYNLQDAEIRQQLATKDGAVEVEKQRQAGLAAQEAIAVAERTKQAEVVVPTEAQMRATKLNADAEAYKTQIEAEGRAEATKLEAGADAERTMVTKQAEAGGIEAIGKADGEAAKAKLLGQAKGEKELAAARAAMDEINLRMAALEAWQAVNTTAVQAMAQAIGGLGEKVHIVQFAGASGGGQTGNPLVDFLMQTPELAATIVAKAEALAGKDIGTILAEVSGIARGTNLAGEQPKAES